MEQIEKSEKMKWKKIKLSKTKRNEVEKVGVNEKVDEKTNERKDYKEEEKERERHTEAGRLVLCVWCIRLLCRFIFRLLYVPSVCVCWNRHLRLKGRIVGCGYVSLVDSFWLNHTKKKKDERMKFKQIAIFMHFENSLFPPSFFLFSISIWSDRNSRMFVHLFITFCFIYFRIHEIDIVPPWVYI